MVAQDHQVIRPHKASSSSSSGAGNFLLGLAFLALFYVQLVHHQVWRDEINAFAIAWDSPTLGSLFHHIHYEGHPWLWYFLLWLVSRVSVAVAAMKAVQGVIGSAIILLIALRSPFTKAEKALLLCGYFFSFEYTVMARMYGLLVLFLVLYCWERTCHPERTVWIGVLLGLMASTDTIGVILSITLLLEYACAAAVERRYRTAVSPGRAAAGLGVYAAIAGFAVWSARTAPDISWRTTGHLFRFARSPKHLLKAVERFTILAFFPVKSPRSQYFWNPDFNHGGISYRVAVAIVLVATLFLLYLAFRRRPSLLLLVFSTILAGSLFGHLIYPGSVRHFGVTFLAFFAAIWIIRASEPDQRLPWEAYLLLITTALSGVWAGVAQWRHPFSNGAAAVAWIRAHHLQDQPIVGLMDYSALTVVEQLHRPYYMIECQCVDTYLLFSARRDNYTETDLPVRVLGAERYYGGKPMLAIDSIPVSSEDQASMERLGLEIEPLAAFTGAEEIYENFYLYRIFPRGSAAGQPDESSIQSSSKE